MAARRPRSAVLAAGALAAAGLALGGGAATAAAARAHATETPVASRPTTREAWTARIVIPVHARTAPRAGARRIAKLGAVAPYNRGPHVMMVLAARSTRTGVWYRLRLNTRPNTAAGWVPAEAVRVRPTPWRVVVRLRSRTMELRKGGRLKGRWKVAVGTPANPTPRGRFAISEVVRQRNPRGFFGTYIITLSAHSPRLSEFDGGDGRVALHGTNRPELLGTAASHGCVRMSNAVANRIGRVVPPGAPVDVVR